jgi:ATP-dependent helicase/nuclease subunit B
MMHILEARAAHERLNGARLFVESFPSATEVLIVGASREAADDLARRIAATRGVSFGLHRASLTQVALRLAAGEMARRRTVPATALGAEAIAARVTFEALRAQSLTYFAPVARFPGFARALASTLSELRLAGLTPAGFGGLEAGAGDVARLLARFETALEQSSIGDRAALLTIATRAAADGALETFRRMPMVLLDVRIDSSSERGFVEALTAVSPAVFVTVPVGDDPTLRAVCAIAGQGRTRDISVAGPTPTPEPGSDLERTRVYLFGTSAPPSAPSRGEVVFFSAPGEGRECVEIARRALDEARAGTPFDEMAVLLRAPDVYGSLLEVALTRAGIPAFFARGNRRPDPAGRAFLALLDCALAGLSAQKFAEYLSLGQVPPLAAGGAPPADRAVWVRPENETLGPAADAAAMEGSAEDAEGRPPRGAPDDADDRPVVEGTLRAPWRWE